jgi:hypothetical protein
MRTGQEFSVDAAREAAARDELAGWVERFLASPGSDNAELGRMLAERELIWTGPVEVPLDDLHRLAGPPGEPVLVEVDDDYWRDDVEDMEHKVEAGWEPPPVIATHRGDHLVLEDGNHRVESLRRAGEGTAWTIIGFERPEDLERYLATSD